MAKHVAKQLGQHQLQKELESSDPAVRQKAMEKLADAMRQQREKEQQENQQRRALEELDRLSKALKSDDPQTGEEAQRKLDNLAKQLAKQLGQEQLQKDLQSNDPATRQKALEKLQQELAKQVAKNLGQEQLQKELESNDPAVRQKALDKLNQLMKQRPEKDDGGQANVPGSGGRTEDALGPGDSEGGDEANPANRKKAFELQLEELKKKLTPDMLKKLNMTEKERDEFLKACEEALKRMPSGPGGKETLPKSQEARGQSSGVRPVDPKNKGPRDNLENAGSASAPPEYRNASKDFSEELAKRKKNREKK